MGQQCGPSLGNSYEELKRQREEEINGLKEALKVRERTHSAIDPRRYLIFGICTSSI